MAADSIHQIITRPVHTVSGFASGFRYPAIAALFILRHPSLWPWCIIPILINAVIIVALWIWTGNYSQHFLATHIPDAAGWYWELLRKSAWLLAVLLRVLITLVTFIVVGTIAALPFNDLLSEKTDKLAGGWHDPRPFSPRRVAWELIVTGAQEGKRMTVFLLIMVPLFALSFVPVLAPFTFAIKLIVTALFLASDYISYPMERRGALLFRYKFLVARRHLFSSLGFGMAVTCLLLVPLVNFLFFPLAVVGGTLYFNDLVRQHGDDIRRGLPDRFNPHGPPGTASVVPARK